MNDVILNKPLIIFKALLGGAEVKMNGYTFVIRQGVKLTSANNEASNCLLMIFTKENSDGTTEPHYVRSEMPLDDFLDCTEKMPNEEVLQISVANVLRAEAKSR